EFAEYRFFARSPNLVLVDTTVVAQAPTRFLVSGMGDALATWFEARTAAATYRQAMSGGLPTSAALSLARLCYETLLEYGLAARLASQQRAITPAFERIVEANTLLSGLGFESGGLAAAHGIHNGLTALPQTHNAYHGEKVAVGTIAQLLLENRPMGEVYEVIDFALSVGLPVGFGDIATAHTGKDDLRRAAELAVAPGETTHNEPFTVTPEMVVDALLAADSLGRARKQVVGHPEPLRRVA
nr:iron-containing alcohol dehydrogenase [Dehalococcoidales bacterium]